MVLHFSKFKFTENLFSKSADSTVEITETSIIVSCFPYFTYNGVYNILEIQGNSFFGVVRYVTEYKFDTFYIDISKNGKKVDIFNSKREGIILKQ